MVLLAAAAAPAVDPPDESPEWGQTNPTHLKGGGPAAYAWAEAELIPGQSPGVRNPSASNGQWVQSPGEAGPSPGGQSIRAGPAEGGGAPSPGGTASSFALPFTKRREKSEPPALFRSPLAGRPDPGPGPGQPPPPPPGGRGASRYLLAHAALLGGGILSESNLLGERGPYRSAGADAAKAASELPLGKLASVGGVCVPLSRAEASGRSGGGGEVGGGVSLFDSWHDCLSGQGPPLSPYEVPRSSFAGLLQRTSGS